MNIAYACDDKFALVLGVSLMSLYSTNLCCNELNVYIIEQDISNDSKKKLEAIADSFGRTLHFVSAKGLTDESMKSDRGSQSAFSRLYLHLLLPDIDKILYLDCDLLVLEPLDGLYDTDINDYFCAGIRDCISKSHLKDIRLPPESLYVNSGVLLLNLTMWRSSRISERFNEISERYRGMVPYTDQGIINLAFFGKIMPLELKYNVYTALFDFSYENLIRFRKPAVYFSKAECDNALAAPTIVHFTTSFLSLRPWIYGCKHPYADLWLQYYMRSPWAEQPLGNDSRKPAKKLAVGIYKHMPSILAAKMAGILHAYIYPFVRKIRRMGQ